MIASDSIIGALVSKLCTTKPIAIASTATPSLSRRRLYTTSRIMRDKKNKMTTLDCTYTVHAQFEPKIDP